MRFHSMSDHEIYEYRETNSDPWTYCKLSPKSEKPNVRPIGDCNGKPFFSGNPIWNMNYNFIYDKNGNKWSVFNPNYSQNNFFFCLGVYVLAIAYTQHQPVPVCSYS